MFSNFCRNALIPLLLRLTLAAIFVFHGMRLVGGVDHQWGARWNPGDGAPPALVQLAIAWGELIGGIALALGFLTRLAAIGIIAIMAGAIATVHWPKGFDITEGGFEYNFTIIMICLCLVLGGPGNLAVDRFFRIRRRQS
jgi:putative oxidoreductase